MAKVIGVMLTIIGTIGSLGNLFLYLNSSVVLKYNPADAAKGLLDVGLAAQIIFFGLMLIFGILMISKSTEPAVK